MLGAIAGDIIGSVYEGSGPRAPDFELFGPRSTFTDDTVLTVAVAEALLDGADLATTFHRYYARYPGAGYGGFFHQWAAAGQRAPYGSFGNGAAMRASPTGWLFDDESATLEAAEWSAAATHDHPYGIAGAQAVALAIFRARHGAGKAAIIEELGERFGFRPGKTVAELRAQPVFDATCQGTLPVVLAVLAETQDFEETVRAAVSVGGDADTNACIAGSIAEALYGGLPTDIEAGVRQRLDAELVNVVDRFRARIQHPGMIDTRREPD